MSSFVTKVCAEGQIIRYTVMFETRNKTEYENVQKLCRIIIDGNSGETYTPEEAMIKLVETGQSDPKFKLGETIKYSPSEVKKILDHRYERRLESDD